MGKIKNRQFWESANMNSQSFMLYYNRLLEIALARFEWTGLPATVDPRFLELALFSDGNAVFFKDDAVGFLGLRVMPNGELNVYDEAIQRIAYGSNGYYNPELDTENSVLIYNNLIRSSSIPTVEYFAKRLWSIDRTIDININAQKTPLLITCEENERLAMKNLYMKYQGNEPVIMGSKDGLKPDSIRVIQTGAPLVAPTLQELKQKIWYDALTYLGVPNMFNDKKERLNDSEVQQLNGGTTASRLSHLAARQQACEKINRMFGLDVWCDYRADGGTGESGVKPFE